MKRIKTLLILILYFVTHAVTAQHQTSAIPIPHNVLPIISDLKTIKTVSWCRLMLLPTLLTIVACMHKDTIVNIIHSNPVSFIFVSYLVGNYLIDTVARYKRVSSSLDFLLLSHTMNRYMLCAFAIKNNILQQYKNHSQPFNEQQFFQKITLHAGYTVEELEFFTTELTAQCLNSVNDITLSIHQDSIDDHMYYLLKDKITIEQILAASKHDPILYQALLKYLQNPEEQYESILETIGLLIKDQINSFMKKNLHIFPQAR